MRPGGESSGRPVIFDYTEISVFLAEMVRWRKTTDRNFSIRRQTKTLKRCSPALVSAVLRGTRRLTADRIPDFARLLDLTAEERAHLLRWIEARDPRQMQQIERRQKSKANGHRAQNHLLRDWLNVYVKDAVRLEAFRPEPFLIHKLLGGIASPERIERSLNYLLHHGFLRKTIEGQWVENETFVSTSDEIPDAKIRAFHKQALYLAKRGIDLYPLSLRRESAVILPLNAQSLAELKELLKEFYGRLIAFAEAHADDRDQLFQVLINLCPVGGKSESIH